MDELFLIIQAKLHDKVNQNISMGKGLERTFFYFKIISACKDCQSKCWQKQNYICKTLDGISILTPSMLAGSYYMNVETCRRLQMICQVNDLRLFLKYFHE